MRLVYSTDREKVSGILANGIVPHEDGIFSHVPLNVVPNISSDNLYIGNYHFFIDNDYVKRNSDKFGVSGTIFSDRMEIELNNIGVIRVEAEEEKHTAGIDRVVSWERIPAKEIESMLISFTEENPKIRAGLRKLKRAMPFHIKLYAKNASANYLFRKPELIRV
jgi:hypothetical protein